MGNEYSSNTDSLPIGGPLGQRFGFDGPAHVAVGCHDPEWRNYFEEIFVDQLGEPEYVQRLKTQAELFQCSAEKGTILDKIELKIDTAKFINVMSANEKETKQRASHWKGMGLYGQAKVDPDPAIPESDFFKPGRLFEVRARHSCFPSSDDHTKICTPSLSLKFADLDEGGPLDFIFHCGRSSPFFSSDSIFDLLNTVNKSSDEFRAYLLKLPIYLASFIENARILPDSLYHVYYHAQTVYHFKAKDEQLRLARFRIIPADGSRESGRVTKEQQLAGEIWNLDSRATENQRENYLFSEMKSRINNGPVEYQIQIQIFQPEGTKVNPHIYNATIPWKESMCPWLNFMTLTLDSLLEDDISEITRYDIGNLSDPITIPGTDSDENFNAPPNIRKVVYAKASSQRPKEIELPEGKGVTYQVTTVTGNKLGAGTESKIRISLIGTGGRTPYKLLDKFLVNDHEKGSCRTYDFKAKDIGELLCAKVITKREGAYADWYLDHVKVQYQGDKTQHNYFLPCYRWFTEKVTSISLTDGTAILPQQEKYRFLTLLRKMEILERQDCYQWRNKAEDMGMEDFPGYISAGTDESALPYDARFNKERILEVIGDGAIGIIEKLTANIRIITGAFKKVGHPFKAKALLLADRVKTPTLTHILEHWSEDEEFGRQILQGMNPLQITLVEKLPEYFATNEVEDSVKDILEDGNSLEAEVKAKKVYMISYPELSGFLNCGNERYLCDPACLLYVKKGKLIPVAIKLSNECPIFTKVDDKAEGNNISDWLMAKMWVKVADLNVHQLGVHLMGAHLTMEAFAMATLRNLPNMHPVYKLLQPHINYTCAINTTARGTLLPEGKVVSKLFALGGKPGHHMNFSSYYYNEHICLDCLIVPKDIDKRNVRDSNHLPGYLYRDDALVLWDALLAFVKGILELYYKNDSDVTDDHELQAFMNDLRTNGLHAKFGLPDPLENIQQLCELLTGVIFRVSCGHASVNFGQLDYYGFTPNAPTYMRCPPPKKKTPQGFTPHYIRNKVLPDNMSSVELIDTAALLSNFSKDEIYLGNYPQELFTEKKVLDAIGNFQNKLREISSAIKIRNKDLAVPYNYLNPEQVPNSIAV